MITVTDNRALNRFEAHDGDELAGFAVYILTPEMVVFTHTEVAAKFEGKGVGSQLAKFGIESAESEQLKVLAVCPFIGAWLAKHPELAHLEYRSTSNVTD